MSDKEPITRNETAPQEELREAVITLYQPLGGATDGGGADGHALARRIWDLEADGCQVLHLRINSAGGSVVQGYSLFSALRHTKMQVHTWLDGLALSMAGLIFLAGRQRHMAPWGLLMLHNPSISAGEHNSHENMLAEEEGSRELLGRIRASLLEMYATSTGLAPDVLSGMMDAQTWLTASRCLELGLAHGLTGQQFPAVEKQLDLLAACAPVLRLEPAALEALAACVQSFAEGEAEPVAALNQAGIPPMPDALNRISAGPDTASFRELERTDPARLEQLRRRDPVAFQALYDRFYRE